METWTAMRGGLTSDAPFKQFYRLSGPSHLVIPMPSTRHPEPATLLLRRSLGWPSNAAGDHRAHNHGAQAQKIVGQDVGGEQDPMALFKVRHGFKSIAGKSCVRPAKPNRHQQPPQRIGQHALRGPHQEESQNQAAADVDDQRSVREGGITEASDDPSKKIAQVSAEKSAKGDPEIGLPFDQ